jgi:hypothetical protein
MNGWDFLEARAGNTRLAEVPVLVVSAAGPGELDSARTLGAPVCMSKPFDIEPFMATVDRLCSGPVRQCAWCGQVMDEWGRYKLRSGRKLRWATHGICPGCNATVRAQIGRSRG